MLGWYSIWHLTFSRNFVALRKKLTIVQTAQKISKKNEKKLVELQLQKDLLSDQCKKLYRHIPAYQNTLDNLFVLSKKYNLLSKGADHIKTEHEGQLTFHTIEMSARGTFSDLLSFYTAISKQLSHVGVIACSCKQSKRRRITMKTVVRVMEN
jgi:hypothetical protein